MLEGEAVVIAPSEKISWNAVPLPEVQMKTQSHNYEQWLLDQVRGLEGPFGSSGFGRKNPPRSR